MFPVRTIALTIVVTVCLTSSSRAQPPGLTPQQRAWWIQQQQIAQQQWAAQQQQRLAQQQWAEQQRLNQQRVAEQRFAQQQAAEQQRLNQQRVAEQRIAQQQWAEQQRIAARDRALSRRPLIEKVILNQSQTNIINQDQEIVAAPAEPAPDPVSQTDATEQPGSEPATPAADEQPSSAQPPPAQPEPARRMRLGVTTEAQADQPGLVIRQVFDGFPAAASGLEAGDVILAVNGHAMRAWDMLNYAIDTAPGVVRCVVRDVRTGQVSYLDIPLAR